MTYKEKAEDLVNRNRMILMNEDTDCGNEILCTIIAIKNSHIVVDEILEFMDNYDIDLDLKHQFSWWKKVKVELDNI
jgi:hypothetical protein